MLHIAVVCRDTNTYKSSGSNGVWSSTIGPDRVEVVQRALKHAKEANLRESRYKGEYTVLVGELHYTAQQPVTYELIPIKNGE